MKSIRWEITKIIFKNMVVADFATKYRIRIHNKKLGIILTLQYILRENLNESH